MIQEFDGRPPLGICLPVIRARIFRRLHGGLPFLNIVPKCLGGSTQDTRVAQGELKYRYPYRGRWIG